jgi:hypothetical protein
MQQPSHLVVEDIPATQSVRFQAVSRNSQLDGSSKAIDMPKAGTRMR